MSTFTEKQKFNIIWAYISLAVVSALNAYLVTVDIYHTIWKAMLMFAPAFLFWALFQFSTLYTKVDQSGISYRFPPVLSKERHIPWRDIKEIKVTTFSPIKDYGGYGWRKGFRKDKAYIVQGNQGLYITTHTKEKIMIGTQCPAQLQQVINLLWKG